MNPDPSRSCTEADTDAIVRRAKGGREGFFGSAASLRVPSGVEPLARNLRHSSAGHDRRGCRRRPRPGKQRRGNDARSRMAKSVNQQPTSHRQTSGNHATLTQHRARHGGGARHLERTSTLRPGAVPGSLRSLSYGESAAAFTISGSSTLRTSRSSARIATNVAAAALPPGSTTFSRRPRHHRALVRQRVQAIYQTRFTRRRWKAWMSSTSATLD